MTLEEYEKEMKAHYFYNGCYHTVRNPITPSTSGNHHVINATHYLILKMFGANMASYAAEAWDYIMRCREAPGIFNRAPDKFDHQAHDDYIAIFIICRIFGFTDIANEMVKAGKPPFFYYDNTEETKKFEFKNWFGRFGWTAYTFANCSTISKPGIFSKLCMALYYIVGAFNKDRTDTSGRILRWLQVRGQPHNSLLVGFAIWLWRKSMCKLYKSPQEMLGIYHGRSHPFARIDCR